jgi:hypothetical protein
MFCEFVTGSFEFSLEPLRRGRLTGGMNKRSDKQRRRSRRKQQREASQGEWAGTIQVVGKPSSPFSEPRMREATLDDCEDDCPLCQEMRKQILSGNPPQVMAFD